MEEGSVDKTSELEFEMMWCDGDNLWKSRGQKWKIFVYLSKLFYILIVIQK